MTAPSASPGAGHRTARVEAAEWARLLAALAEGGDALLDAPTALTGWTVEDLARHVHWGMTLEADGLRLLRGAGEPPGAEVAAGTPAEGPRAGLVAALAAARDALVAALEVTRDAPEDAVVPMPYGPVPLGLARQVFTMEAAMHTYDLVAAARDARGAVTGAGERAAMLGAGDHGHRGSVVLPACATVLAAFWPALAAAGTPPAPGTTLALEGPTVRLGARYDGASWTPHEGPADAVLRGDDAVLLLVAYGRVALEGSGVDVVGDAGLAARLKAMVPGP
ncbi:maleylpyruvate isomerase N-terminal domain-containing protein [Actinotalea solisilvae]|uniref:maleylpyruvate isomerase N-terminal domain-containing protein n=1 Tax=Actinotalea solisilvae TaxID=2072922 RepID=UPI0018F1F315|nr:maleylpyruvate isomerase N-terminal domain-containing protein [Actinotalea solisilvae]